MILLDCNDLDKSCDNSTLHVSAGYAYECEAMCYSGYLAEPTLYAVLYPCGTMTMANSYSRTKTIVDEASVVHCVTHVDELSAVSADEVLRASCTVGCYGVETGGPMSLIDW